MKKSGKPLAVFTESAIMTALATVLSFVKLFDLPFGGSITAGSMLPFILVAYRHGFKAGTVCGLCGGAIQLLCGISTLSYATSSMAAFAIILLDYIVAFGVAGLASLPRRLFPENQSAALVSGGFLMCLARYVCHVISGCTVWAGVSIPDTDGLLFSASYNATYMLPETVITLALAVYLSHFVDLRKPVVRAATKTSFLPFALSAAGWLAAVIAVVFDTICVFGVLQNSQTGEFSLANIASANGTAIVIITVVGAVLAAGLNIAAICVKNHLKKA